jgi:RNA recognition motif-containing protein
MKKILVGNLDLSATEESLRSAFEPYGAVESISFATAGGFALVQMKDTRQANRAVAALDGTRLTAESESPLFLVTVQPDPSERRGSQLGGSSRMGAHPESLVLSGRQRPAQRSRSRRCGSPSPL